MRGVLDLDSMSALARRICAIKTLRDDAFKVHAAGRAEQILADVALLVVGDEDTRVKDGKSSPTLHC
jgi:hypothetical protein